LFNWSTPPQTIISLPVHTVVKESLATGALVVLIESQVSVARLYVPPVFQKGKPKGLPPQTIISLPVQTAA
jgi:hypothetical protein